MKALFLLFIALSSAQQIVGNVSAVYDLLERVLPSSSSHFVLSIVPFCPGTSQPCYQITDTPDGKIALAGTSASELTAGVGFYLREFCNLTIGWPRGGGSSLALPKSWPVFGTKMTRSRNVPWSYAMNVCTHSYSFVWYDWKAWESFIDWMALSGINLVLAMTGQEEVQYKVFSKFGLSDSDIRSWFNGPAFLTWSRGQNEYGAGIAGPLPRSWMQAQHALQIQILARYRSLGIVGQLPGFQGNVPVQLKDIQKDDNITRQGDTGWMNSVDPLFGKIADVWMQTMIADFGTDHWYQLDGYFDGSTAPWLANPSAKKRMPSAPAQPVAVREGNPPCTWSAVQPNKYLNGCCQECTPFPTLAAAQDACVKDSSCGGVTLDKNGVPTLRQSIVPSVSSSGESSYFISNEVECHEMSPDASWRQRGEAAYQGLSRTDPHAIWSFQGWAIVDWSSAMHASYFRAFVEAVPYGNFVVVDMSVDGSGEWKIWNNASFFGAPFIWTTLHDFGGTDAMKGDLSMVNQIPFEAIKSTSVWGTGFTPEGIDQNPVYYEMVTETNFRDAPIKDITSHVVRRAMRRYQLNTMVQEVADAWTLLSQSVYTENLSVQDGTGIPHLPGWDVSHFQPDRFTPVPKLCLTFQAWGRMIAAASKVTMTEPFRYDLINVGREVLAQLSTPMSSNFSDAFRAAKMDLALLQATGGKYIALLKDVDALVQTDSAFLLGPWLTSARAWGTNSSDCGSLSCPNFYEWNARCQITTWNPTTATATQIPSGPVDYASKHWSGLIADYYGHRAELMLVQALKDQAQGEVLNQTAVDQILATHANTWTTSTNAYPTQPVGDPIAISQAMLSKYSSYFSSC